MTPRSCVTSLAGLLLIAGAAHGQECVQPAPTLGITAFDCRGAYCRVHRVLRSGGHYGFALEATVEPRLAAIDAGGPAAGLLEEGDLIVAIDDSPITTRQATTKIAELEVGRSVGLVIRRNGRLLDVTVIPVLGCILPTIISYGSTSNDSASPSRAGRGFPLSEFGIGNLIRLEALGLTLVGEIQSDVSVGGTRRSWFRASPVVAGVVAGTRSAIAGLSPGDVLMRAGGHLLTTPEGGAALMGASENEANVPLQLRRGTAIMFLVIPDSKPKP